MKMYSMVVQRRRTVIEVTRFPVTAVDEAGAKAIAKVTADVNGSAVTLGRGR